MPGNAFVPQTLTTRPTYVYPGTLRKPYPPINVYDGCLAEDAVIWESLVSKAGGLMKHCCPQGRKPYTSPPWISMPAEGRRFRPISNVQVSAVSPFTGLDVLVLEEIVPTGYNGVITDIVCGTTAGSGFVEGSGVLTWRLAADGRFLRDQGEIITTLGSLVFPSPVPRGGLRVYSENHLQFYVALQVGQEAALDPNSRIICSLTGWYWPR